MTNTIRTLGRLEWQATLLLAVVFGAGVAVGAAFDRSRQAPARMVAGPPPAGSGRLPPYLERMQLTPEQHEKIKAILDAQKPRVDTVMDGVLPRLRAISDTTFARIRDLLAPEQQAEFDRERPRRELAPGMPGAPGGRGGRENMDGRGPPPPGS
jgi:hypothetical protein